VGTKALKATEPGAWFHLHDTCKCAARMLHVFELEYSIALCTGHCRNYPRGFGIKMVEAAEGHAGHVDADVSIEDSALQELDLFKSLDWSDMWDDVHSSVSPLGICITIVIDWGLQVGSVAFVLTVLTLLVCQCCFANIG